MPSGASLFFNRNTKLDASRAGIPNPFNFLAQRSLPLAKLAQVLILKPCKYHFSGFLTHIYYATKILGID